jgi:hypothetical protein
MDVPPSHPVKSLQLVHKIMLVMQLVFAGVIIGLVASGTLVPSQKNLDNTLQIVAVVMAAACYLMGTRQYKQKLMSIRESSHHPQQKWQEFRAASILLWAMLEAPTLFCIISFLLTGNYAFIALVAALLFLFFIFGVNKQKLLVFLNMSEQEVDALT